MNYLKNSYDLLIIEEMHFGVRGWRLELTGLRHAKGNINWFIMLIL